MNKKNVTTAFAVAIIIGSLLNIINSYDVLIERRFSGRNTARIILTYITPFCVSLYSSVKATRQKTIHIN